MGMLGSDIKLIATDIDGTMLRSDHSLSPRVRKALWSAKDAGMHVVPATGRPITVAGEIFESLGLPDYWVLANGAITYHLERNEIVRGYWMDQGTVPGLVEELRSTIPDVQFTIERERTSVFEPDFRKVVPVLFETDATQQVENVLDHLSGPIQKVLVFQPELNLDELYKLVVEVVGDRVVASYSGMNFVELAAEQVTKAHALSELANELNVTASEVAAFGDNHNDLPMFEWAGSSFAMGNASKDVQSAADYVIGTNDEDALAYQIETLLATF